MNKFIDYKTKNLSICFVVISTAKMSNKNHYITFGHFYFV